MEPLVLPEGEYGIGGFIYSVNTLPSGLVFDTETRTISGTPTTLGTTEVYIYRY